MARRRRSVEFMSKMQRRHMIETFGEMKNKALYLPLSKQNSTILTPYSRTPRMYSLSYMHLGVNFAKQWKVNSSHSLLN